jgi:hypothetical protein
MSWAVFHKTIDNTRPKGERQRYCAAMTNGNGNMMRLDSKKSSCCPSSCKISLVAALPRCDSKITFSSQLANAGRDGDIDFGHKVADDIDSREQQAPRTKYRASLLTDPHVKRREGGICDIL